MKRILVIFFMAFCAACAAAALMGGGGCKRQPGKKPAAPAVSPEKKEWTAQEIAKDPQGYLLWSDQQVVGQIAQCEVKLRSLNDRRVQLKGKQEMLVENLAAVEDIRRRLTEAYQRAEDEDRWPARMGGRTFTREKAQAILDQTKLYLEERRPLQNTYEQLFRKMDEVAGAIDRDVKDLNRLREKIAIDVEQVRLSQGMADLDQLRVRQSEMAAASQAAAKSTRADELTAMATPKEPPGRVNIDEMLK
jgi:hypothetical protein